MTRRRLYDEEGHPQFVTFSTYKRRRLLDTPKPRAIVASFLASQLKKSPGKCLGYVVMPDHVHAVVWFGEAGQLSEFMKQWKRRTSMEVRKCIEADRRRYAGITGNDPIWQARYYAFNILSEMVLNEKLEYMHNNPIKAGLVARAEDWVWSSARWYLLGKSVGVPLGW